MLARRRREDEEVGRKIANCDMAFGQPSLEVYWGCSLRNFLSILPASVQNFAYGFGLKPAKMNLCDGIACDFRA